jgi:hypothetical protein
MPNTNDPQKPPPPDPTKGTGTNPTPIPGKSPKEGPTPDGIYKPPQTRKVVAAPASGVIAGMFGALIGVVCRAD